MKVSCLPGGRLANAVLWVILLIGAGLAVYGYLRGPPAPAPVDERTTISVLRSRPVLLLITRQVTTQVVIDHHESTWSGDWHGVLWGVVKLSYGIDVEQITTADLRREGDIVIVRLPEPRLLSFSVEPGSVGFLSKSTAIPKLLDIIEGGSQRQKLEDRLREKALDFARGHEMLPTRKELVQQLNEAAALLTTGPGLRIRFE